MRLFFVFLVIFINSQILAQELQESFTYLSRVDSTIQKELRYLTSNNFIGKPIRGYLKNKIILSTQAAEALKNVQKELFNSGLSLKVFDAYRPQQSVDHFTKWAGKIHDTLMKRDYYPTIEKSELFTLGYIASKSGHTRGSTVDLTIVDLETGKELDMGSPFDFFGEISHTFFEHISPFQKKNRMLLRSVMIKNEFIPYDKEWWHFTLKNEPYPDTYFNFPIE